MGGLSACAGTHQCAAATEYRPAGHANNPTLRECVPKNHDHKNVTFSGNTAKKNNGGEKLGWKDGEKSLGERKMRGRGGAKDFIGCRALTTRTFPKPHHHSRFYKLTTNHGILIFWGVFWCTMRKRTSTNFIGCRAWNSCFVTNPIDYSQSKPLQNPI